MSKTKLKVNELEIVLYSEKEEEFISLSDMAKFRDPQRTNYIIQNWIRTRSTIEFLGLWEQFHNPGFNSIEFDAFKNEAGSNSFTLTPKKWIEATNAIGINSKAGRCGGTYAHKDIASINELAFLSNLESMNADMIRKNIGKEERFHKLKAVTKYQIEILNENNYLKALKKKSEKTYINEQNKIGEDE